MTERSAPSSWLSLRAVAPTLLALALVVWAARWFIQRWDAVVNTAAAQPIQWGWLVLAGALLALHAMSAMVIWRQLLAVLLATVSWRTAVDVFAPALLARYVPGRIWANGARLALSKRAGVRYGQATGAMIWEAVIALSSAACVAALTLYGRVPTMYWRTAAVIAVATLLSWFVLTRMHRLPAGLHRAFLTSVVGWFLFATAHLAIARSVAPVGFVDLPLLSGAMAFAWSAGFLAIVVPLGFGVRDGLLLLLLASVLNPTQAMLFVALSRLVQLVVDATLTGAWLLARRGATRAAPSA